MSVIIFLAQILITLVTFAGELNEDPRFADEKLLYRS